MCFKNYQIFYTFLLLFTYNFKINISQALLQNVKNVLPSNNEIIIKNSTNNIPKYSIKLNNVLSLLHRYRIKRNDKKEMLKRKLHDYRHNRNDKSLLKKKNENTWKVPNKNVNFNSKYNSVNVLPYYNLLARSIIEKPAAIEENSYDNTGIDNYNYEEALIENTSDGKLRIIPLNDISQADFSELVEEPKNVVNVDSSSVVNATTNITLATTENVSVYQKILEELEQIKNGKTIPCPTRKEELSCEVTGSWISNVGGVRLDLNVNASGHIQVTFSELIPPKRGLFCAEEWEGKGDAPFLKHGPFTLTAWSKKLRQTATFIGQCRICGTSESIYGHWIVGRLARDCRDLHLSTEVRADILHKEVLHTLRNEKLGLGKITPVPLQDETMLNVTIANVITVSTPSSEAVTTANETTVLTTTVLAPSSETSTKVRIMQVSASSSDIEMETFNISATTVPEKTTDATTYFLDLI